MARRGMAWCVCVSHVREGERFHMQRTNSQKLFFHAWKNLSQFFSWGHILQK